MPLSLSLQMVVLAARASGLIVLDGVHLDLNDMEGFKAACVQGKQLGFDGKTLIHPKTIDISNRVFRPSEKEVLESKRIVEHWNESSESGLVVLDGKLVERLHFERAQEILSMDHFINENQINN